MNEGPHLATILIEKRHVPDIKTAFDKYLAEGAPAYVPKYKQTTFEAIDLIKRAGGISVLAHPMVTKVDEMIPQFVSHGLDGIEAYYPNQSREIIDHYLGIAQKHKLLVTGGSDDHGEKKKNTYVGKAKISYELVDKIKEHFKH